jgi:UDP-N-acetyl-D-glucosamine dehydrogenase
MPEYVVQRVADALNTVKKPINGSRIHAFGVAYKRDVSDMRESPALDILELLTRRGATVSFSDPYVPSFVHEGQRLEAVPFEQALGNGYDCAVLCTDHSAFDYGRMAAACPLVVDTRNALKGLDSPSIVRL